MKNFQYSIFNKTIESNIELIKFKDYQTASLYSDIVLNITIVHPKNIREHLDYNDINIYDDNICISMNKYSNKIYITTYDVDIFYNIFFNIPLGVWAILHNYLLLHSSSIKIGDNVYAFCGKKGIGKSTLLNILSKYSMFYSDDQLLLEDKRDVLCNPSFPIIKLNKDIYHQYFSHIKSKQRFGKYILKAEDVYGNCSFEKSKLQHIFFLKRYQGSSFKIQKIENDIEKRFLLLSNTIGKSFFLNSKYETYLLDNDMIHQINKKVKMSYLYLPDISCYNNMDLFIKEIKG